MAPFRPGAIGDRWATTPFSAMTIIGYIAAFCLDGTRSITTMAKLLFTAVSAGTLSNLDNKSGLSVTLTTFAEELQPIPVRFLLMLTEFWDNLKSGSKLGAAVLPLMMHTLLIFSGFPFLLRYALHVYFNLSCVDQAYKHCLTDPDTIYDYPFMQDMPEGVYQTTDSASQGLLLQDSLEFDSHGTITTKKLLDRGFIKHGRLTITASSRLPGEPLAEYLPQPDKKRCRALSSNAPSGLVSKKCGVKNIAALRKRFAPHRVEKTSPISRWIRGFLDGQMPERNPRFPLIKELLEICYQHNYDKDTLCTITHTDDWIEVQIPEPVSQALRNLTPYERNDFDKIRREAFERSTLEEMKHVKPMTYSELRHGRPARVKHRYDKLVAKLDLADDELDSTAIFTIEESEFLLNSDDCKTIPVFTKDEKYALSDQPRFLNPQFVNHCEASGLYPHLVPLEGAANYQGIKPRVISAVKMGVDEEGLPGGQFLLCFFSDSIKKHVQEILKKKRTVTHEVTMEETDVVFHFITDTRATPSKTSGLTGKTTTDVLRQARNDTLFEGVISVLIHGDDSLMMYPVSGQAEPLYIECDYSAYDTSQSDSAIRSEHNFYSDWLCGIPEGFIKRSEDMHSLPFTFTMGKEYGYKQDFINITAFLDEAIRLSGAWNTTTGNSLVSAFIIFYVLSSMTYRTDLENHVGQRMPQFDTYSDLRINVKRTAFKWSTDPKKVTFLKMGIVESSNGLTFTLLPSRIIRLMVILSIDYSNLTEHWEYVHNIMVQTMYGYMVPYDYPILGRLYSSVYWTAQNKIAELRSAALTRGISLTQNPVNAGSYLPTAQNPDRFSEAVAKQVAFYTPPDLDDISEESAIEKLVTTERDPYSFGARYGGTYTVRREEVLEMICARYDTNLERILSLEKLLTAVDGTRPLMICHSLLDKLASEDYGADIHRMYMAEL